MARYERICCQSDLVAYLSGLRKLHASAGELKLLPTDRRNPHGRNAITAFTFGFAHRVWVGKMPVLRTSDGTEFDKRRIFPYAYRHTYVICSALAA
jgi:hypothetical protein